jgi:hypothetical protein
MESSLTSAFYERAEGYRMTGSLPGGAFSSLDFDRFRPSKGLRSATERAPAAPIADFSFVIAR